MWSARIEVVGGRGRETKGTTDLYIPHLVVCPRTGRYLWRGGASHGDRGGADRGSEDAWDRHQDFAVGSGGFRRAWPATSFPSGRARGTDLPCYLLWMGGSTGHHATALDQVPEPRVLGRRVPIPGYSFSSVELHCHRPPPDIDRRRYPIREVLRTSVPTSCYYHAVEGRNKHAPAAAERGAAAWLRGREVWSTRDACGGHRIINLEGFQAGEVVGTPSVWDPLQGVEPLRLVSNPCPAHIPAEGGRAPQHHQPQRRPPSRLPSRWAILGDAVSAIATAITAAEYALPLA